MLKIQSGRLGRVPKLKFNAKSEILLSNLMRFLTSREDEGGREARSKKIF